MKLQKTFQLKLYAPTKRKRKALLLTMKRARKGLNFYIQHILAHKGITKSLLHHKAYNKVMSAYKIPSALVQTIRDQALETFHSHEGNGKNGKSSVPHFEGFPAIRLDGRLVNLKRSRKAKAPIIASVATVSGRIKIPVTGNEYQIKKACQIIDGEIPLSCAYLVRKGEDFYINISYAYHRPIKSADEAEYFAGVDVGVNNLATLVVVNRAGEVQEVKFFSGARVGAKRKFFGELRKSLGRRKLLSMIRRSRGREKDYMKDTNHKISRIIADMACKYHAKGGCVLVLEKLVHIRKKATFSKKQNRRLQNWNFRQLLNFLEYKTHDSGIPFRRVSPAYTSQCCRHCGKHMVRDRHTAKCKSCGYSANADYLGAYNISLRLLGYMSKGAGHGESGPEPGIVEAEMCLVGSPLKASGADWG